ncbi:MAG: phospholipase D-like domain-containing protein [Euryarchaeota archaeon]|nr:phospholipase D-like domain-containing protein [Euryarchaeota archaeon]
MRAWVVLLVLVLTAPIWSGPLSSQASASSSVEEGLIIFEVCPAKPIEFVTIMNTGSGDLNASRLKVTDGEGTLALPPLTLRPGGSITLFKNISGLAVLNGRENLLPYTNPGIVRKGSFALSDDGDQVTLMMDDVPTDRFCYGNAAVPADWNGEPFRFTDKGHMAVHTEVDDGSDAAEWSQSVLGRTTVDPFNVTADVMPLVHPDDGSSALLELIERSVYSIVLSVYTLEDPDVAYALAEAAHRGVEIDVLLEGQPVGGISTFGKRAIVTLLEDDANVLVFRSNDSYRRYEYVHAKYAIFDSRFVSISSENWGSGLSSNRGWGVIVDSEDLALRMNDLFQADTDRSYGDVQPAPWYQVEPFTWGEGVPDDFVMPSRATAQMTLITSPGGSVDPIRQLIRGAEARICIEAMSMDMDWMRSSFLLDDLLAAARSGVEVKVLLDSMNQYEENKASASELMGESVGLPVECKLASPYHDFSSIHNKGIIADDDVLFSSINLGAYAFNENREVGAIVRSQSIADRMSSIFMQDWMDDCSSPVIVLPSLSYECDEGKGIIIDAGGSYDNSGITNYTWDVDEDGVVERYGPVFSWEPEGGEHVVLLKVSDGYGNEVSERIVVSAGTKDGASFGNVLLGIPAAIIASVLAISKMRKRIKSNK